MSKDTADAPSSLLRVRSSSKVSVTRATSPTRTMRPSGPPRTMTRVMSDGRSNSPTERTIISRLPTVSFPPGTLTPRAWMAERSSAGER